MDPLQTQIVLMTGLPGTGKSTLARALAERLHGVVLDKDAIRAALFPEPLIEYSQRQDDFCMHVLLQTATYLARYSGLPFLFLDGRPCILRKQVEEVAEAAATIPCPLKIIRTFCSDETAQWRLETAHIARNRNFQLYQELQRKVEPISLPNFEVNTDLPLEVTVTGCLGYLLASPVRTQRRASP